ncbi:hypothetical protein VTH82DRAFT_4829 [Thermothelomyces myriococcoides]
MNEEVHQGTTTRKDPLSLTIILLLYPMPTLPTPTAHRRPHRFPLEAHHHRRRRRLLLPPPPPPPPPSQNYPPHNYPPNPYTGGYQPPPPPAQPYGHYPTPPPPPPPSYTSQPPYGQPAYPPSSPTTIIFSRHIPIAAPRATATSTFYTLPLSLPNPTTAGPLSVRTRATTSIRSARTYWSSIFLSCQLVFSSHWAISFSLTLRKPKSFRASQKQITKASRFEETAPASNEPKVQDDEEQVGEGSLEDTSGWDPKLKEEFKQAFPTIETKPADPVGIPLPLEYTEEPTIPPAYNARCVKSEFFREDNQKDFGRSIREHPSWVIFKDDPVFRHYQGMVMRHFPGSEHEYPSYDRPDAPPSPSSIKMPPRFKFDRSSTRLRQDRSEGHPSKNHDERAQPYTPRDRWRRDSGRDWYDADGRRPRKRSLDAGYDRDDGEPEPKRVRRRSQQRRDRSRENYGRANSARGFSPGSPRFNLGGDPWSPQPGEMIAAIKAGIPWRRHYGTKTTSGDVGLQIGHINGAPRHLGAEITGVVAIAVAAAEDGAAAEATAGPGAEVPVEAAAVAVAELRHRTGAIATVASRPSQLSKQIC